MSDHDEPSDRSGERAGDTSDADRTGRIGTKIRADLPKSERSELLPKVPAFDPEPHRERLRSWIAAALIVLFMFVVGLAFLLFLLTPRPIGDLKDFLIVVIPPVTSLVSAVVGFYYGSTSRRD